MKVAISSENPVKIESVKSAFFSVFPDNKIQFLSLSVESGVNDQPFGDEETLNGAKNRVRNCKKIESDCDYYVGIEGGVSFEQNIFSAFAWIVIGYKNKESFARTASFELPPKIYDLIKKGYELGEADDLVFEQSNSKQKSGAVGLLTHQVVNRKALYEQAVILALIPPVNALLF